ncbi:MAG TPA: cytotoxic translational repressor of toxin-antitoxin stability system [Rhizobium sp.]
MKKIAYSNDALKTLSRMQPKRAALIISKIDAFASGERVNVKKMQGSNRLRIRVGDDRVIIEEETMTVTVIKIGPRGDVYK